LKKWYKIRVYKRNVNNIINFTKMLDFVAKILYNEYTNSDNENYQINAKKLEYPC